MRLSEKEKGKKYQVGKGVRQGCILSSCLFNLCAEYIMQNARLDELQAGISPKRNQPWICIGRMMLKLKLQYFGHLMQRADSLEKTLMLGKIKGKTIWGQQRRRYLDSILTQRAWIWANSGIEWQTGKPGMLQSMGSQKVRHDLASELQPCIF